MSCPHGNHESACDICDEVDAAYIAGANSVKKGKVVFPDLLTEEMVKAVCSSHNLHPADVVDIYNVLKAQNEQRDSHE